MLQVNHTRVKISTLRKTQVVDDSRGEPKIRQRISRKHHSSDLTRRRQNPADQANCAQNIFNMLIQKLTLKVGSELVRKYTRIWHQTCHYD